MSTKRTKKTDDDGDVSKTFRSAIRHDIVGLLEAWASGADPSWPSFKAEWKAREMSLLHHAPFRVNNPPSRAACCQALFRTCLELLREDWDRPLSAGAAAAGVPRDLRWRCGCVFALHTFHGTQCPPTVAVEAMARAHMRKKPAVDARRWMVGARVDDAALEALLRARDEFAANPGNLARDAGNVLRGLAESYALELACGARPDWVDRSPAPAPGDDAAPDGAFDWAALRCASAAYDGLRRTCAALPLRPPSSVAADLERLRDAYAAPPAPVPDDGGDGAADDAGDAGAAPAPAPAGSPRAEVRAGRIDPRLLEDLDDLSDDDD